MRFALHRRHSPAPAKQAAQVPAKRRAKSMQSRPRPLAAQEVLPPVPVEQKREISIGSNEGIRTVKLRRSTIVWQKPKKSFVAEAAVPAATHAAEPGTIHLPATAPQRRPVLSVRKPDTTAA